MAYVNVDIEIDEFSDDDLIDEIKVRVKKAKTNIFDYIADRIGESYQGGGTDFEKIVYVLGLNHLASKEDIIKEINEKF